MDDDDLYDDERVAVGAGLRGTETDVAELGSLTDDGLDDYVALATARVVVKVAVHNAHGLHDESRVLRCIEQRGLWRKGHLDTRVR